MVEADSHGSPAHARDVNLAVFVKGLVIGVAIAAPVGPIGLLCIQRTLAHGRAAGLASGLGAATADAVYGAVAAAGLSATTSALVAGQGWLRLVGGLFLCYLGARTLLSRPAEQPASPAGAAAGGVFGAYATALVLTLTNPLTILSFAAIFAGLGVTASGQRGASVLIAGVFLGSAVWWLVLSGGVGLVRTRIDLRHVRRLNRVAGAVIAAFGLIALLGPR